jgi:hypothetical protein
LVAPQALFHFSRALGFSDFLKRTEYPGQDYLNDKREVFLTRTLITDMGAKLSAGTTKESTSSEIIRLKA